MYQALTKSPLGIIRIKASDIGVISLNFIDESADSIDYDINIHVEKCIKQIQEYFEGDLKEFNLKLDLHGTEFQKNVWNELIKIPFGETKSYNYLAKIIGDSKKVRAVANANAKNPIAIIVPCHRIIGSDGTLTGYAGGLWRKQWLIEHEAKFSNNDLQIRMF